MPRSRLSPRREPVLERGRDTRAAILAAAAQVFSSQGYAKGTTNRIAARAGVSIGSLYQYFPNKDSILVALLYRHMEEGVALVLELLAEDVSALGLDARIARYVRAMLMFHESDPKLHRVLFEEAPHPRAVWQRLAQLEATLCEAVATMFRASPDIGVAAPDTAAWIAVQTVEAVVHRFVLHGHDGTTREALVSEVTTMLCGYLAGERSYPLRTEARR
ncbi:MAG: TetR/AcrR family transcriptional regulator [Polyangiaceae bacterium]